jgi:hypothetical protein
MAAAGEGETAMSRYEHLPKATLIAIARAAEKERRKLARYLAGKHGVTEAQAAVMVDRADAERRRAWRVEAQTRDSKGGQRPKEEAMSSVPYMPTYVADLLSDTEDLTNEEFGAYVRRLASENKYPGQAPRRTPPREDCGGSR